jgi:chromosome segregation ATPase
MKHSLWALMLLAAAPAAWPQAAPPSGGPVYRCPGPPILYTDQITEREAKEKNCRTIEGAPVTVVQTPKPAAARTNAPIASPSREGRSAEGKVDPNAQKQRDGDARRLLEAELKREEARLADLQKEFNNGEPERQGNERNYQRYADRVAEMRSAIQRKEEDIAAIKRELAKLQ